MSWEAWGDPPDRYFNEDEACELEAAAFIRGAQACREMVARSLAQGGSPFHVRETWHPDWGDDPGRLEGELPMPGDGA